MSSGESDALNYPLLRDKLKYNVSKWVSKVQRTWKSVKTRLLLTTTSTTPCRTMLQQSVVNISTEWSVKSIFISHRIICMRWRWSHSGVHRTFRKAMRMFVTRWKICVQFPLKITPVEWIRRHSSLFARNVVLFCSDFLSYHLESLPLHRHRLFCASCTKGCSAALIISSCKKKTGKSLGSSHNRTTTTQRGLVIR